jgi:tetratricopeptide (TPR) repeat protein
VTTLLAANIAEGRALEQFGKNDLASADRLFAQQRDLLAKAEQQDPTNPIPRILLAKSLLDEFNRSKRSSLLDDALMALNQADRIRAGTQEVSAVRVAVLKAKGDPHAAIAELRRALELNPDNAIVRRDLIQSLLESDDWRAALEAVDAAIAANPTLAVWHELRGDLLRATPQLKQAAESYTRAYELAPSTPMLLKLTGMLLNPNVGECRVAAEKLSARSEDMKTEAVLRETYARALACLGQHAEAVAQLRLAYATRAESIKQGGDPAKIRDWFFALLEVYPIDRAVEAEQLIIELTGSKPDVYGLSGLARIWIRTGDAGLSRATELQRQAVALCDAKDDRLRAELNNELGSFLVLANDLQGAADAYEIVTRLQPEHVNAMNNLAYIYAEDLDQPARAMPLAERLAQLAPEDGAILDTVGWVYFKNGNLHKAKQHLQQAVAILPLADSYIHLASVLLKLGDVPGAEKALAEAEKLRPSPNAQQKIKPLRDDIEKSKRSGG